MINKELIVNCPTQKLFDKILIKMLKTTTWNNGDTKYNNSWKHNSNGKNHCLIIIKKFNNKIMNSTIDYCKEHLSNIPITSAETYLNIKQKHKVFNI